MAWHGRGADNKRLAYALLSSVMVIGEGMQPPSRMP